jgi:transcriptional regulator with XRE-family HTH domain
MGKSFGQWLAGELRRREWNASDFAARANVTPSMVSRWLRGTRPSPESCDVIADVLAADLDMVLTLAGHRPSVLTDDDPAMAALVAMLRRIRLTPDRENGLRSILEGYLAFDRKVAAASTSAPAAHPSPARAADPSRRTRSGGRPPERL